MGGALHRIAATAAGPERDSWPMGKADTTIRAYESDWRQFEAWCDTRGLDPLPARPEAVATYLASLAQAGNADSTIGRVLAAIGWRHCQAGEVAPTARDERMIIADTPARHSPGATRAAQRQEGRDRRRAAAAHAIYRSTPVFGSEHLSGALLDRLTHHVHILEMNGESFRLASSRKGQKVTESSTMP